ncbi:uncharacterized protein LOC144634677 isoform X1 [Oculina patagonica]
MRKMSLTTSMALLLTTFLKEPKMKLNLFSLLILFAVVEIKSSSDVVHLQSNGFKARSCLDYLQIGKFENGFYWLFDDQDKQYVAYCDLSSEPGAAWTLVMSWNREYKDLAQFSTKPFLQDAPINHNTPNWYIYRQTLARMKSLRSRSTYWRATCSFNIMKEIDYRDYLRGKFSDFDIMTYLGHGICKRVDYVNIRGHAAGSGTTARFWQVLNTHILHIDSSISGCAFIPTAGSVPSEDNFGFYGKFNQKFRCTMGDTQTTNWWFGGYMAD